MNKKENKHIKPNKVKGSFSTPFEKKFLLFFVIILVVVFLIIMGFVIYWQFLGKIHIPEYVLGVIISTLCVSILGSLHIILRHYYPKINS